MSGWCVRGFFGCPLIQMKVGSRQVIIEGTDGLWVEAVAKSGMLCRGPLSPNS